MIRCQKCKKEFESVNGFSEWTVYRDASGYIKYNSCKTCAADFIFFFEAQAAYKQLFQNMLDLFFAPGNPCMLEEEANDGKS